MRTPGNRWTTRRHKVRIRATETSRWPGQPDPAGETGNLYAQQYQIGTRWTLRFTVVSCPGPPGCVRVGSTEPLGDQRPRLMAVTLRATATHRIRLIGGLHSFSLCTAEGSRGQVGHAMNASAQAPGPTIPVRTGPPSPRCAARARARSVWPSPTSAGAHRRRRAPPSRPSCRPADSASP